MRRPELPIVSFLSIPLLLASLPSHVRAGSVSTIALIAWLGVMSLIRGVNALIWANNFVVRLEVWCDITTKLAVGFTVAVPAAALCILRHLESVASNRSARSTKADKIRRQRFEAIMCFGLPVVFMALHYVVQGHRFDLFEDFGCYPTVYFSIAAIFLVYVPPLALSLTTFVYAAMALRHFMRHRIEFAAHLQNSHSAISASRYFRLMSLAIVEMFWDTGVNIYIIWFNTLTGVRPWISWENVHSNFSRVGIVPEFINPPELVTQLLFQWWIIPVSCIAFFIFFGFGEEAVSDYRGVVTWFRQKILRHRVDIPRRHPNNFGLPTHLPRPPRVSIAMAGHVDDTSEHEIKTWDSFSLNLPRIIEGDAQFSPSTDSTPPTLIGCAMDDSTSSRLSDSSSIHSQISKFSCSKDGDVRSSIITHFSSHDHMLPTVNAMATSRSTLPLDDISPASSSDTNTP